MGAPNPHAGYLLPNFGDGGSDDEEAAKPEADDAACKHCGRRGLSWVHTGERWRLVGDKGHFHTCAPKATADDFAVLSP